MFVQFYFTHFSRKQPDKKTITRVEFRPVYRHYLNRTEKCAKNFLRKSQFYVPNSILMNFMICVVWLKATLAFGIESGAYRQDSK